MKNKIFFLKSISFMVVFLACNLTYAQDDCKILMPSIAGFYPMQEFQGWTEWRRTGYPRVLVGPDDDDLQGVSPRRMPYPTSETQLNEENYDIAVQ